MPPTLSSPYQESHAMLPIRDTWITSHYQRHVLRATWTGPILLYCQNKNGWTWDTLDNISWGSIWAARNKCTPTQLMQTSKIMHDWLPVMHMQAHMTGTKQCPSCSHSDETLDHLFHCPHPTLLNKWEELLEHLQKKGLKLGTPRVVMDTFVLLLQAYFAELSPPTISPSPHLRITLEAQVKIKIGLGFIPCGFLTTHWIDALNAHGCSSPHQTMAALIHTLWLGVTDSLWRTQNSMTHNGVNLNTLAQERETDAKLRWFLLHFWEVLSHHYYSLIDHLLRSPLDNLSFQVKWQWLFHLEAAQAAYAAFLLQLVKGQCLLTQYFWPVVAPHG